MSKFTRMAVTTHALSVAAMEEASRYGQREADIEHLLLALTVSEQPAGQVLRGMGITLDAARTAIEAQHAEHLASLGVVAHAPEAGRIVFHETSGYEWTARAMEIFQRSSKGGSNGDAAAVLRELTAEPSGLITELLHRLGTSPDAVNSRLDAVEHVPAHTEPQSHPASMSRHAEAFVTAPAQAVWSLLADPVRIPEWDPALGSVLAEPGSASGVGATWEGRSPTERPDGKPLAVKPRLRRRQVECCEYDEKRIIAWRLRYPDAERANCRRVRIELEPAAGGTQLTITLRCERSSDGPAMRVPLVGYLMRPFIHFSLWGQLAEISSGISRGFR